MGNPLSWSSWERLEGAQPWTPIGLRETLLGGQAFRWQGTAPGTYLGCWADLHVQLRLNKEREVEFQVPLLDQPHRRRDQIRNYLENGLDWQTTTDALPWKSDPVLAQAILTFPGIRILQQPFWEVLVGFLCSSNKQITQIRQMCEALADRFGERIHKTLPARFPTPNQLAASSIESLLACKLGYRAKYIWGAAEFISAQPSFEQTLKKLPYLEAKAALMELPGVGPKVADCVLLYGLGVFEAFPMDTWIARILDQHYHLTHFTSAQKLHFAKIHFGPHAGLAQQFLFSYARGIG